MRNWVLNWKFLLENEKLTLKLEIHYKNEKLGLKLEISL